ncbi:MULTISPECIES: peptidoglycan DD-metalloendopeptidase family protein [Luteimonas]|uniref:peptidoglycan DD-metalloendopeptidase family protein n=1 Tax=Luteimonas TaxID=83614 RepID=UPI0018EB530D|nr:MULTISPECIES: peptidoglycan DD-metalloendopeptidase family protein [Luteimonas]
MRIVVVLLSMLLLAGCGSSRVIREGGSAASSSTPRPGQSVAVQRGDTLYRIATNNGISALDLAMWNNIAAPYTIYPGQRLRLYPSGGTSRATASTTRPTSGRATAPVRPTRAPPQPAAAPPAQSPFRWQWPTDGQVIGRFTAGEPTKQGVDIGGTGGQPVSAAAEGTVVYSGSGLVGYGELIIVKHNEQWLTAYGHNRTRKVNEGDRVSAGQQIAEMGRSGAARDMLHFEIRYNGKPVDPLSYLPAR